VTARQRTINPATSTRISSRLPTVCSRSALKPCAQAINEFRAKHGINEVILPIDGMGVYWRRNR